MNGTMTQSSRSRQIICGGGISAVPTFVTNGGSMYNFRIRNFCQFAPSLQDEFQHGIYVSHLGIAIHDILQSLQTATLNAHFLGVRQRCIV